MCTPLVLMVKGASSITIINAMTNALLGYLVETDPYSLLYRDFWQQLSM